jgi:hypothetical protein
VGIGAVTINTLLRDPSATPSQGILTLLGITAFFGLVTIFISLATINTTGPLKNRTVGIAMTPQTRVKIPAIIAGATLVVTGIVAGIVYLF